MSMPWPHWPLLLASLLTAGPALAAGDKLAPVSSPTLTQLRAQQSARATESLSRLRAQKSALGLNGRDDFRPSTVETDDFGLTHTHFTQLHQGVPVWGAQATTHLDASGRSLSVTADGLRRNVRVGVSPLVDASDAISLATLELAPRGLLSAPATAELFVYPETRRVPIGQENPSFALRNAADYREEVVRYALAWHVHTELDGAHDDAHEGATHQDFLIDAQSGEVLKQWDSLQTVAARGTGRSQYSGEVQLDVWQNTAGQYELRDTTRAGGEGLRTFDVKNVDVQNGQPVTPVLYTDEDNVWGDGQNFVKGGSTSGANGQTAAVDAHYGLLATWDYFQRIHGRNGIDNLGTPTYNRVHVGVSYPNAFWLNSCFCMSYGDGTYNATTAPSSPRTMTALDVTGHELSHGVMSRTAALVYAGESGGLNEASSDIFGTMTEFWVRGGRGATIGNSSAANWRIGEDLVAPSALRYLYKPSLDRRSPDAWFPGLENVDVHYSSGPMNRAFYFLAQGARPASEGGDFSSGYLPAGMAGLGNDKAAAIWYRAITVYLYPSANYLAARTFSLQSATDLYGSDSAEYRAVQNAFAAINVGATAGTYDDRTPPSAVSAGVTGLAPLLTLIASASDNVGVVRVDFAVDGAPVGSDTSLPFELPLDVSTMSNGTHSLVVTAFDKAGNRTASAPLSFNVFNPYAQLLRNPGFEQGAQGWAANPLGNINYPATGARSGLGFVWLNGYGSVSLDDLSQEVSLPASITRAALTFYLKLETLETGTTANDTLRVEVRDPSGATLKTLATWSNLDATLGWVQRSFDLTEFKGQTVRLSFVGSENGSLATHFKLDDFALRTIGGTDRDAPRVKASVAFNTAGTRVGLFADVSDNGYVDAVEFLLDGTSLGTTPTSFSRTVNVADLTSGTHSLVVRAPDAAGNVGQSESVTFVIDKQRTQLVVNPGFENRSTGSTGLGAWPTTTTRADFLVFSRTFPRTGLSHFLFSSEMGPGQGTLRQALTVPADATSAIYSFWLIAVSNAYTDGLAHHTLTAKVRDASGTELRTLEVFSNLSDSGGAYAEHRYDLSAYKGQAIQLFFDVDMTQDAQVPGGRTRFFLDDITLTATSTPDTQPPALSASVEGTYGTVKLNATVSDNVWTSLLEFFVDGAPAATLRDVNGAQSVPLDTSGLFNGAHRLMVRATDVAGNTRSVSLDFVINNATTTDTTPPTVSASVQGELGTTVLLANASDDTGVTFVEFYVDGAYQGVVMSPPYRKAFDATVLAPGAHTLQVVAHDAYGHSTSATAPFSRESVVIAPTDFIAIPVGDSFTFSASATPGALPLVWSVTEGTICGSVTAAGVYTAPSGTGLCHVRVASSARPAYQSTALVKVFTADLTGDHVVDGEDMGRMAQAHGSTSTDTNYTEAADLDASRTVDDFDAALFVNQFGR